MRARDLVYETISGVSANRSRSLLTILGIVIGISAVIAMTALIGGFKKVLLAEVGTNQARIVSIYAATERQLTLDDLANLHELMPQYERLSVSMMSDVTVSTQTKSKEALAMGVLPDYDEINELKLAQGNFLSDSDQAGGALVAVVDQATVRELFGGENEPVIGKEIQIGDINYAIIGVVESSTSALSGNQLYVYVPFSTCAERITGYWDANDITGLAAEDADMSTIEEETKATFANYLMLNEEDVDDQLYVYSLQSAVEELDNIMMIFQLIMTLVASISLLVGGIGIMNMMLTNVTERIREIGLRKALGAHASDITQQFLLEAILVCLSGGIIGTVLGYLGSFLLSIILSAAMKTSVTPVIEMQAVVLATSISVGIGVVFGYYPARRAAKLDPVESLHYQ